MRRRKTDGGKKRKKKKKVCASQKKINEKQRKTYIFRAGQHLYDEGVSRPLGEVTLGIVGEGLDDAAQQLVLQEGSHVALRLVVRLHHPVAKLQRGRLRGGLFHLAQLLRLVLHHQLAIVGVLAELFERRRLRRKQQKWKQEKARARTGPDET